MYYGLRENKEWYKPELKFLIPITLLDMTSITVIDHGMSLSVLYQSISFCFRWFRFIS